MLKMYPAVLEVRDPCVRALLFRKRTGRVRAEHASVAPRAVCAGGPTLSYLKGDNAPQFCLKHVSEVQNETARKCSVNRFSSMPKILRAFSTSRPRMIPAKVL